MKYKQPQSGLQFAAVCFMPLMPLYFACIRQLADYSLQLAAIFFMPLYLLAACSVQLVAVFLYSSGTDFIYYIV
jgi:hypothetical protein